MAATSDCRQIISQHYYFLFAVLSDDGHLSLFLSNQDFQGQLTCRHPRISSKMDSNNTSKRALNSQTDENCSPPSKKLCSESDESHIESSLNNKSQSENSCNAIDRSKLAFGRVSEEDVGITEYISNLPGFTAVMKERYSDFVVNEIDTEGNVVRLTNFSQPQNPENDVKVDDLLDAATVKSLEELVADEKSDVKIDVTDMDKDARKQIHVAIRKMFDGVESSTEDKDEKKFIIVKKFQTKKR
ncbi:pseudouridylate synthase 7 homolog [Caerostris extrusa]|uniref:Pseudouridylate synthase 7 homolog n=1 Tax=Caerostris extrusa TaxID=172846 RepID=A0AAV4XCS3_CAEEX|nr:pseudouridylate synthase 7 homolog [Caerostris extrusa]